MEGTQTYHTITSWWEISLWTAIALILLIITMKSTLAATISCNPVPTCTYNATGNTSGDISAVYAGTGLTGGGNVGDVTLTLNTTYTNNYANWDTAYAWGNHAIAGYHNGSTYTTCTSGNYSQWNGTHLTCQPDTGTGSTDGNNYTSGISFSGTTTKTLNLARDGMTNLTATFTDIDTDTYNTSAQMIAAVNGTGISITGNAATVTNGLYNTSTWAGDLSGTGLTPTVAKINGASLGTTTATSTYILIANGTHWITRALSGDATITNTGTVTVNDESHTHQAANITATTSTTWAGRVTDETGTGNWVFNTSPTITTPTLTGTVTGGTYTGGTWQGTAIADAYIASASNWYAKAATGNCGASQAIQNITNGTVQCITIGTANATGTVTQIDTGTGLTGGPITTTGTISLNTTYTNTLYPQLSQMTTCTSGNYSTWNGSHLNCAPDTGGTGGSGGNVTAIGFSGTTTKTLQLNQTGGTTILNATFTDIDTDTYNTSAQMIAAVNGSGINILGNAATATSANDPRWTANYSLYTPTTGLVAALGNFSAENSTIARTGTSNVCGAGSHVTNVTTSTTGVSVTCTADASGANSSLTGAGTTNAVAKWSNTTTLTGSGIIDDGTTINLTEDVNVGTGTSGGSIQANGDQLLINTTLLNITTTAYINNSQICTAANGVCPTGNGTGTADGTGNVTSITVTGTTTKTLQLNQTNGTTTLNATWTDLDTDTYNTSAQMIAAVNGSGISITGNAATVTTETGDISAVNAGTGLTGGGTTGDVTLTLNSTFTGNYTNWNTAYAWGNHSAAGYITDGNTNWDNTYGYYNNITNFTGTKTDTKICTWDATNNLINCTYTDLVGEPGTTDGNNYTTGISFSGTTTKTLNLARDGMTNLTATFDDIDTDTYNTSAQMITAVNGSGISITGNAGTATLFANDPADCTGVTWAAGIRTNGSLICTAIAYNGITAATSGNWATVVTDETGTGAWVFNTSPTITTPTLTGTVTGGTFSGGTWQGTAIADAYIASSATWYAKAATGSSTACTYGIANITTTNTSAPTVTCAAQQGDITSVNAGTGIQGGATTGDATITLNTTYTNTLYPQLSQMTTCTSGNYSTWNGSHLTCSPDVGVGGGDGNNYVTSIMVNGTTTKTINIERSGLTNLTADFTDTDTYNTTEQMIAAVNGTGISITGNAATASSVLLNDVDNPTADTTWTMTTRNLEMTYTTGTMSIEQTAATTNDLVHIHQHTGNPAAGSDLLHLEATDADMILLNVSGNRDILAYFNGNISVHGSKVCTAANGLCPDTYNTTAQIQAVSVGGDLTGTIGTAAVTDDSHNHGTTTISGLDSTDISGLADVDLNDDFGDYTCNGAAAGCTIDADAISLGTDTTGTYLMGITDGTSITITGTPAEAWNATIALNTTYTDTLYAKISGIAASNITSGTLALARGGLAADVSGYSSGLFGLISGTTTDIDTESELESALGSLDVVTVTASDITSANLATILTDETGTGYAVYNSSPTISSPTLTGTVTGGTYSGGTWQGTAIADAYVASAATWTAKAATGNSAACTYGITNITLNSAGVPTVACATQQGTVTSITAGTGLTGGAITTSGTIALNTTHTDTIYAKLSGIAASNITTGTLSTAVLPTTMVGWTNSTTTTTSASNVNVTANLTIHTAPQMVFKPYNTTCMNVTISGTTVMLLCA